MLGGLVPRGERFFALFNAHAERIAEASRELAAMIARRDSGIDHAAHIDAAEHAADQITHETIALLHRSFITPLDREQIYALISSMDDIVDLLQSVAESIVVYDVRAPGPEVLELAEISNRCCEKVRTAVALLAKMKGGDAILRCCDEIDRLESDADRVMRAGISRLFREVDDIKRLMIERDLYQLLESVTDRCEDVANVLEGMVLENS